ncbi:translocation and assembly module lipoprotein TamL [Luteirhabdus pelagi]|uniref:translocation and assembly module lipoprotein TamL n=1 Tax=Luteirhabdus pelagi TaxID=2792783 RepID=UPI00293D8D78|nr:BamA/TamA family outer membrane protein [Luteirhabdus pelagi]
MSTKILFILTAILALVSCNAVKYVPEGKFLLTENTVMVDGEAETDSRVLSQLYQKPNPEIPLIGVPLGLHIYNLADPQPDSTFQRWLHKKPNREENLVKFLSRKQVVALDSAYYNFNKFLQRSGDAPVIVDEGKMNKSVDRLKRYYASYGYFNTKADYEVNPSEKKEKRASVTYNVKRFQPYVVDSIKEQIASPIVDSLFQRTKKNSFIEKGKQYDANDFVAERDRLTIQFRNSGLYHFDQDYVGFEADTVKTNHKANITYMIPNREVTEGDSTYTVPFQIHDVSEVRIVTDYTYENRNKSLSDSTRYEGYSLFSYDPMKFRPKAITDAISITPNEIFRDIDRTLTYNQINNLKIFKYPNISYQPDPADTTGTDLIATILLTPRKKYTLGVDFDAYTSTIQQFGVGFSSTFTIRNIFRGAEILSISGTGSVGSSADKEGGFFNTSDLGGNVALSFPRILFPVNTEKIIPKYMSPNTELSVGFSAQNNIGLDRQNINGIFNYNWQPSKKVTHDFNLINVQFVRNLNTENYFNVYRNTYTRLNEIARQSGYDFEDPLAENPGLGIPDEADAFIAQTLNGNVDGIPTDSEEYDEVLSIAERKFRLTENNLILASNFTWTRDTREGIYDLEFYRWRWKLESAGNLLSALSGVADYTQNSNGKDEILGVAYSQYIKGETEYIKHWALNDNNVFAIRGFAGLAVPYGNSTSIPFTRSYFAGGTNDNRGWRAYDLGPGSSGGLLDFNEANLKLAFNAEYRFTILGAFKGALFTDVGNIWNAFDDVEDPALRFDGLQDLKELAVATGFGLRYDFGFFVFRLDVGFKTHNPARREGDRWFRDFNFTDAVYNIGINYPF